MKKFWGEGRGFRAAVLPALIALVSSAPQIAQAQDLLYVASQEDVTVAGELEDGTTLVAVLRGVELDEVVVPRRNAAGGGDHGQVG